MSLNPTMRRPTSASRRHRSFCSRPHNHALVARRALRGGSRAADVFKNGKILGIDVLADQERIARLDLTPLPTTGLTR